MESAILEVLKRNLNHVWKNEFKDRVKQGIFIIMRATSMTAQDLQITERQVVNEISVNKMGDMLLSL